MSKKELQHRLDKMQDTLLHNKQLPDEDLEDVFAGFGNYSSYLGGGLVSFFLRWLR